MERIPFDESEMTPIEVIKGRTMDRTLWSPPITHRENVLMAFHHQDPFFLSHMGDIFEVDTRANPEMVAGHTVRDGQEPYEYDFETGEFDAFGVRWVMDKNNVGPIEALDEFLLEDMTELDEKIVWPNPEEWPWAENAERDQEWLAANRALGKALRVSIFSGLFERLISWLGFENAAIALIDPEQ